MKPKKKGGDLLFAKYQELQIAKNIKKKNQKEKSIDTALKSGVLTILATVVSYDTR